MRDGSFATGNDLFPHQGTLSLRDACIDYRATGLVGLGTDPDVLLQTLHAQVPWQQHQVVIAGNHIDQPRLSAWYGDVFHRHASLAEVLHPLPWTAPLLQLKQQLETALHARFNSLLVNLYRDGQDAIGWHADDEPALGATPLIASISLGQTRTFLLRRKDDHRRRLAMALGHGSLLVMSGTTQRYWQHAIRREAAATGARINLTFRLTHGRPVQP
jgi:alkylated DNA repair dioxygenase AlkB